MLIEFKGEHTGSVVMFGNIATQLLKMMGQSGQAKGAIEAPEVPAALDQLKRSLQNVAPPQTGDDDDGEPNVSLQTRANPLIDLLERSVEKNGYVMWKPQ